jgi:hypothetical protein
VETKSEGLQGREILIIIPRSSAAIECVITTFDSQSYIKDMRRRDSEIAKGWGQIATPLSVQTSGGKQKLNCANTKHPITFTPLG